MVDGLIPYVYMYICDFVVAPAKRLVCSISKIEGDVEITDDL